MTLKIPCLISTLLTILCSTQVAGQALNEYQRLVPETLFEGDRFGHSIASNGDYIAVSAPNQVRGDGGLGVVYIFNAQTGNQVRTIEPIDPQEGEYFARTLSMSDTQIAIENHTIHGSSPTLSSVSIFDLSTGTRFIKIPTDDIVVTAWNGYMALFGDRLAIGSPNDSDFGKLSGAVYLYDAITGALLHKLYQSDPHHIGYGSFGWSLAVHEGVLAISAPGGRRDDLFSTVVYLFDISTGNEIASIPPSNDGYTRSFAQAVAINGQYVAMGSSEDRTVWLYDRVTGELVTEIQTEDGHDDTAPQDTDLFGISIAMDDNFLLVSAITDSLNGTWAGAAYVFSLLTRSQIAKFVLSEGTYGGNFGDPLSLNDGQVIIGERWNRDLGRNTGAAYLYDINSAHLCSPDFDDNGLLNTTDIELFINHYTNNDPSADFDVDGIFNFYDISEFIHEFTTGCP